MLAEDERKYLDDKYALRHIGGDNRLLSAIMRCIRKSRPILDPANAFSVFGTNDLLQIWLQTPACRFSQEGRCTICNYWAGQKIPELISKMEEAVVIPQNINTILINTCGSCLDKSELAIKEQEQLFGWLSKQAAEDIILETHMATLSEDTVQRVRRMLLNKNIYFEIGQESTDTDVQFYSLNKPLPKNGRKIIIDRIHMFGAKSIVNVVLGAPFLNREEQIKDAVDSITELLWDGADHIMLFPVNIKPNTLVCLLHDMGMYDVVDCGMIVRVLEELPEEFLPRVGIAWYGEHQEDGVLPPYIPEADRLEFNKVIAYYNKCSSVQERKTQLEILLCGARDWEQDYIRGTMGGCFVERLDIAYQMLCDKILNEYRGN